MPEPAEPVEHEEPKAATFLARWREWWRGRHELDHLDRRELERMAGEFGMTGRDLEDLVARGPHAADLLYERMLALGIERTDVDRIAGGLMRELKRTCACCGDKRTCEKDLASRPDDPVWKTYCPNAVSLEAVRNAKGRFPM
jgi:hypothetical protein